MERYSDLLKISSLGFATESTQSTLRGKVALGDRKFGLE